MLTVFSQNLKIFQGSATIRGWLDIDGTPIVIDLHVASTVPICIRIHMNNLTTSPVAQEYALARLYIGKGHYTENHSEEHDRFRCLNHRYELDRSTLDLNSDASITGKLDRAVQIGLGTCTRIAYYFTHECYI